MMMTLSSSTTIVPECRCPPFLNGLRRMRSRGSSKRTRKPKSTQGSFVAELLSEMAVLISHWTHTHAEAEAGAHDFPSMPPAADQQTSSHLNMEYTPHPAWSNHVWDLLLEHGRTDIDGEDPVIFIQFFYIDHVRHPHGHSQRPRRFSLDWEEWANDIKFVWEDLADPDLPLDVIFVDPPPVALSHDGTIATVIVQQNLLPERIACLISTVHVQDFGSRASDIAHSVAPFLQPADITFLGGVSEVCHRHELDGHGECTLHHGYRLLPNDLPVPVHMGIGITIRVPP